MPRKHVVTFSGEDLARLKSSVVTWVPLTAEFAGVIPLATLFARRPDLLRRVLWWMPAPTGKDWKRYARKWLCFLGCVPDTGAFIGIMTLEDCGDVAMLGGAYWPTYRGQPAVEASKVFVAWAHWHGWPEVRAVTPYRAALAHMVQVGGGLVGTEMDARTGRRVYVVSSRKKAGNDV